MKPIEKGHSYCRFVYDGSDDVFEFAFVGGYLNKAFIEVYKTSDEVGAEATPLEYSLINEYSVRIDKSLLSVGDIVIVKRNTQAEKIVDFQAGALRTPKNFDTATQQAIDISVEAKDAYTAIENSIDQFNELAGELLTSAEYTKVVSDNIEAVKTDAENIEAIVAVSNDFNGNVDVVSMPDWGEVGVEHPDITVPTGGNIFTVASNIESVNIDAENIEYIKKVADNIDTIPDAAAEVKELVEQAKESAINASNSASAAELAKQEAETAKAQAEAVIPAVQEEGQTQIEAITTEATTQIALVQSAGSTQVVALESEANEQIGLIDSAGNSQIQAVTQAGATQVSAVTSEGDTQVSRVQQASATNIEQAEADALEALETALSEHEIALQGVGTAEVQKVQQQGSTSVSEVVSAKDTAITEIVQAGDEQTARASAEADRAKEAADRAESVSVQPDWNQTDSSQKDYIKNKPTLGALASKDVVAYNEVQGTPDLSLYSTKTETSQAISNAISTKADISTLNNYWLKTDRLPAPDLGEVGVN